VVDDTLAGIYLLRADLLAIGPKIAVSLSPYALFGVPLFVGYNPLGQVLTRAALASRKRDELVNTLSAFFQDVARGRRHELHPTPQIGGERGGSKTATRATPPATVETPSTVDTVGVPVPDAPHQGASAVAQLAAGLDSFLDNALELARSFLRQHDLRDDLSLHSLRQLDALYDEQAGDAGLNEPEGRFLAALGVYLGAVVTANATAEWFVDSSEPSPIDALSLRVSGDGREEVFHPVAIALDRLRDVEKGFYGHAVAMCRKL
jgi:hypothetical protein